ncbi:MAG: helix-turn-helix transcriptional regulator [Bacteroidota bacterium]|nr:helix-turn-helix transcriptional regulator [Bacteroidota bacterium]
MLTKGYINDWYAMSDHAILRELGKFIKETRLKKNYTQNDLAEKAKVHRITIGDFEQGERNISLLTLIELLRALNILETLNDFTIKTAISPIQLAKLEAKKRQRASHPRSTKKKPLAKKKK